MPFIGLEEDRPTKELTEEDIEKVAEEIKKQPRIEKEVIKLSQRTLDRLRSEFSEVVVNDYGDGYHKTEEEMAKENQLFTCYRKIQGAKRSYRKLPEFIDATRNCLEFLYEVAYNQSVYEPEEFLEKFWKGKIQVNGMYIPRYTGKDKKRIAKNALIDYILSEEPADGFYDTKISAPDITSEEELQRVINEYFEPGELDEILRDDTKDFDEGRPFDPDVLESYVDKPYGTDIDPKVQRKIMKENPDIVQATIDTIRTSKDSRTYDASMIYDMQEEDINSIAKYDEAYGYTSPSDMPKLGNRSLTKKSDFEDFMADMDDWEMRNTRTYYASKLRTLEEINDYRVKETLERNGYNIRMFWNNQEREKKVQDYIKKERKKENRLRKQLSKIEKRSDARNGKPNEAYRQMKDAKVGGKKKGKKKKSKSP